MRFFETLAQTFSGKPIDWDELEARYHSAIDPKAEAEQEIMNKCSSLFRVSRFPRVVKLSNGV